MSTRLRTPHLLHGGDYNPDQWLDRPDILREDLRLMPLGRINAACVGIFAWAALEAAEGQYTFDWLDRTLDDLDRTGVKVFLATPSGSKPAWMSQKYPETRRCQQNGMRDPHGNRHNHCLTSPVYRERVREMNTRLATRYSDHPAVIGWHVSNEYGGYCYCPLCWHAFHQWCEKRHGSLDATNKHWWSEFWSHRFTDWSQIDFLDQSIHGLVLDYKRFMTDQMVDFFCAEAAPLREKNAALPVTTNLMPQFRDYDYWRLAPHVDFISWDAYPEWHGDPKSSVGPAASVAFSHDQFRAMKPDRPFLLIECTPSHTNWNPICKSKRPGINVMQGLQAVAQGSDGVMYFQFRKGRGGKEKFHGAVVDHEGTENTRVFREVAELGDRLSELSTLGLAGTLAEQPRAAVVFDWQNMWAVEAAAGPRNIDQQYNATCRAHHAPLLSRGVAVDVIESTCDLASYQLVVAPMLYMLRPGVAESLTRFVERGGTLVTTYLTGLVDEHDLCFTGGFPGPLRKLLGIWAEETDALVDLDTQTVTAIEGNALGLSGTHKARHYADIIHAEGATVLAKYDRDFYAESPAVTMNRVGKGRAIHVAARLDDAFVDGLLGHLVEELDLPRRSLPPGVHSHRRGGLEFLFNWADQSATIKLPRAASDAVTGATLGSSVTLDPFTVKAIKMT